MKTLVSLVLCLLMSVSALAAGVTGDTLAGNWVFTHMILDGEQERPVNQPVEFTAGGEAVFYDAPGLEFSRGVFTIENGVIIYTDKRGEQRWQVIAFTGDNLHVDHAGAEMFFERE